MERYAIGMSLLLFIALLGLGIRQELINQELSRQNALYKAEIDELQKKQRLTAQDVGFLEHLIIEGKE